MKVIWTSLAILLVCLVISIVSIICAHHRIDTLNEEVKELEETAGRTSLLLARQMGELTDQMGELLEIHLAGVEQIQQAIRDR